MKIKITRTIKKILIHQIHSTRIQEFLNVLNSYILVYRNEKLIDQFLLYN